MIHLECVRRQIISMQLQRKLHNNNLGNCYVSSGQTKRKKAGQQATPADEPWKSLYSVLNWGSAPALHLQKYEKVRITNQAEYQTISRLATVPHNHIALLNMSNK
jgi:hypothetical protein